MNIGELARTAATKVETVRYYEHVGLLPAPPRTAGNYRSYSATHLTRLVFTRRARNLGFSLGQIRTLLDLADQKSRSCKAVDTIAREHLADVKRKLADLTAMQHELETIIGKCRNDTVADCCILEALAPKEAQPYTAISEQRGALTRFS